jgi:tRNA(Ile)-lysidine synthase
VLDAKAFSDAPREIGLRALATLLSRVGGAAYRPRFERLEGLFDAIASEEFRKARTLHGCRIGPAPKASATFGSRSVVIVPEAGRVKPKTGLGRT